MIHDMSIILLSIWSPSSGALVGPEVNNKDLAICCIFLPISNVVERMEPSDARLILFHTTLIKILLLT